MDGPADPLEAIWGSRPGPELVAMAQAGADALLRGRLVAAIEDAMEVSFAASRLAMSQERLGQLLVDGQLYAFRVDGLLLIPVWQLASGEPNGLLPGLDQLLAVHPTGRASFWSWWIREPSRELGGRSPLELLRAHETDRVVDALRAVVRRT